MTEPAQVVTVTVGEQKWLREKFTEIDVAAICVSHPKVYVYPEQLARLGREAIEQAFPHYAIEVLR